MYVKQICTAKAIPATATSTLSTTVSVTSDTQLGPTGQLGAGVVVMSLNAAVHGGGRVDLLSAPDGTTFAVAKDEAGNNVSVALPDTAALAGVTRLFTIKTLGTALKVKVVGTATGGAGTVDVALISP